MSLDDKIIDFRSDSMWTTYAIKVDEVKKFIKKLKEKLKHEVIFKDKLDQERCFEVIDKEAGDKLTDEK